VGACARPVREGTGPMWDSLAHDSLRAGLVFGKRQRANPQPADERPTVAKLETLRDHSVDCAPSGSRNRCSGRSGTLRFSETCCSITVLQRKVHILAFIHGARDLIIALPEQ